MMNCFKNRNKNFGIKNAADSGMHCKMRCGGSISGGGIPLAYLPAGTKGYVLEIQGGDGASRHLCDMGFSPSSEVTVLKSSPPGAMLVSIKGSRIALSKGMAMRILINNVENI